jgi:peptidoglycan/LPS O-acetylase OafA/YrhL
MKIHYRADIDGLRAVAVISVILYHVGIGIFSGGYVGVDIFFVISGYLISSIILKEIYAEKFSVLGFYERRIKRIFPALYVVMIFSFIAGYWLFHVMLFKRLGESVTATALFLSNVLFWKLNGDYFTGDLEKMPFLHTWSLAVEEQFYIFYPLLLYVFVRLFRKKYFYLLVLIAMASFALCLYGVNIDRIGNFFLAPGRAWEFLCGALIASGIVPDIDNKWIKNTLSLVGLSMIGYAVVFFDAKTVFPGLLALFPVIGSTLVIYTGSNNNTAVSRVLNYKPIVFTGLISYSLYLWHWPVLIFYKYYLMRDLNLIEKILLVTAVFIISYFSWRFVENPFRQAKSILNSRTKIFAFGAVLVLIMAPIGGYVYYRNGLPSRFHNNDMIFSVENDPQWMPNKSSSIYRVSGNIKAFSIGDKKQNPSYLLWGDSHAEALFSGLTELSAEYKSSGVMIADGGVGPFLNMKSGDVRGYSAKDYKDIISYIDANKNIKTVVLSASWSFYAEKKLFYQQLYKTVQDILSLHRQVVLVADIPHMEKNIPHALFMSYRTGRSVNTLLGGSVEASSPTKKAYIKQNHVVTQNFELLSKMHGVSIVYPDEVLFDQKTDKYRVMFNNRLLYMDRNHLTSDGSVFVSSVFRRYFENHEL